MPHPTDQSDGDLSGKVICALLGEHELDEFEVPDSIRCARCGLVVSGSGWVGRWAFELKAGKKEASVAFTL